MAVSPYSEHLGAAYLPSGERHDEMVGPDGGPRPQWRLLVETLAALGAESLAERQAEAARLLRDEGATYNVYGYPESQARAWSLDPVPLQIPSEEWSGIEAGLTERAELLGLVLTDLYGPAELLRKGVLPPEVVYAHRGFLREAVGLDLPERALTLYAADLARGPGGEFMLLSDRSEVPTGAGYALLNRRVMTRVFPSLFRESRPHQLPSFFRALRESLAQASLQMLGVEDPRVVILTPGVRNETYFEHVYLANYLGYTLVEGADLAVRDGRVWLKALGGLEPVDVILRRVDDAYCDPVELRPESRLGVPGLLEVLRRRRVVVANAIGAGVIENPGLWPFMDDIARYFLGHETALRGAASWWCGRAPDREHVLARLGQLVVRDIDRHTHPEPWFGFALSGAELDTLRRLIEARPERFVGQEWVEPSSSPTLVDGRLQPRRTVMRTYAAAAAGGYQVMPGALTRVAPDALAPLISNQAGALSKDTWVLTSEPERRPEPPAVSLRPGHRIAAGIASLGGRAAENLFWAARYAERSEQSARLIREVQARLVETQQGPESPSGGALAELLRGLTDVTGTYPGFFLQDGGALLAAPEAEVYSITVEQHRPGSLTMNLEALLAAVEAVRSLLSNDSRRVINGIEDLKRRLRLLPRGGDGITVVALLDRLVTALMALAGLTHESMSRSLGWSFLELGRRIERGLLTATLLRRLVVEERSLVVEVPVLDSLLTSTESLAAYRATWSDVPDAASVVELLVFDPGHPRALVYQIARLRELLAGLPDQATGRRSSEEMRCAVELEAMLALADPSVLMAAEQGRRVVLEATMTRVITLLGEMADAIAERYLSVGDRPQQLLETWERPR